MSLSATITDIQRFSVHDGPGIRTTVFVKGCNMHCTWCHNPETLSFEPQTFFYPDLCIGCGLCDEGCYAGAKVDCGKEMTLEEVLAVILEDKPYYGQEGGVTLSGGEPICRPEFSGALLAACKREGIGTAIETNMSTPWKNILESVRHADLVMCDLKDADEERHLRLTGARIEIIRENILRVSAELESPFFFALPSSPASTPTWKPYPKSRPLPPPCQPLWPTSFCPTTPWGWTRPGPWAPRPSVTKSPAWT